METSLATGNALTVKQWEERAFMEWLSILVMSKYMGTDENAVIQLVDKLTKTQGDAVTVPLIGALSGQGVSGDSTLEGNEEQLPTYSQQITIDQYRNAIVIAGKMTEQRYPFQIRDKAKPALLNWKAQFDEDKIFAALGSIDGTVYASASEASKDSWLANNADRVLFGAARSNNAANDHSACLTQVDSTTDKFLPAQISLAKRMAKLADPKIRPIRLGDGSGAEVYVMFAHPYCTRDLKASDDWKNAQREAMPRSENNPLFTGAIGMYDGVIIVETDKIQILENVGDSGTVEVAQNFLCGAQALAWVNGGIGGSRMEVVEETRDYKNKTGVAIASMYGVAKLRFGTGAAGVNKDHGVVTVYSSAMGD